jgi:hypothetical protein
LIAATSQPVHVNIGGKIIQEIEKLEGLKPESDLKYIIIEGFSRVKRNKKYKTQFHRKNLNCSFVLYTLRN